MIECSCLSCHSPIIGRMGKPGAEGSATCEERCRMYWYWSVRKGRPIGIAYQHARTANAYRRDSQACIARISQISGVPLEAIDDEYWEAAA